MLTHASCVVDTAGFGEIGCVRTGNWVRTRQDSVHSFETEQNCFEIFSRRQSLSCHQFSSHREHRQDKTRQSCLVLSCRCSQCELATPPETVYLLCRSTVINACHREGGISNDSAKPIRLSQHCSFTGLWVLFLMPYRLATLSKHRKHRSIVCPMQCMALDRYKIT